MSLLHLLSYVGFLAAGASVILSLASGLLWISELIEEHSRLAKAIGTRAVYIIIALHVLLYLTDALPLPHILFSIAAHVVYLQNFAHTWPYIALTAPVFAASCVLALANHFLWFFYFSQRSRAWHAAQQVGRYNRGVRSQAAVGAGAPPPGFAEVATFFGLCVWLVPLFLFLSLSANDNALPTSVDGSLSSPTTPNPSRTSLFKKLVDYVPWLRRRRGPPEGILVSHTPTHSAPSTPRTSFSSQNIYSLDTQSVDDFGRQRIALRAPPRRSQTDSSNKSLESSSSSLHVLRTGSPDTTPAHVRRRTVEQ